MEAKWYGLNALEIKHSHGRFMIDPYVSRNRQKLFIQEEVDKYLTSVPDFVLMTHAHWDHLCDMPYFIKKTNTVLYASRTACSIMRHLHVPEANLHEIHYGERLQLPGNVTVTVLESRHMGYNQEAETIASPDACGDMTTAGDWKCGECFAFLMEVDGQSLLNIGSANMCEDVMHGMTCDTFFCGISRWQKGFPEMLQRNITFKCLIPTHHDEFTLPLSQFYLRNDLIRLQEAIPALKACELPVLTWHTLDNH